jgi:YVTN family beta-propeller protein
MNPLFSSAKSASFRRWAVVVSISAAALLASCTNETADAEPVVHGSHIPGLSTRAHSGAEAYVANYGYDSEPGATVTAVDLFTRATDARITTGTLPDALAFTPNGHLVLVTDEGEDQLSVIDTLDGDITATIATGDEPDAVSVSPNGDAALVANSDSASVTPVDLQTMRAGTPIPVGAQPDAIAIGGHNGDTALVADLGGGTVTPVNLATMSAGAPIPVGAEPDAIAMSPDGETAVVANLGSNSVTFVDLSTLRVLDTVEVGIAPTGVATQNTDFAWVAGGESIVPVSFASHATGAPIDVGHLLEAIAIAPNGIAWVADNDPQITAVDLATRRVMSSVSVGGRPSAIVIPPGYS